MRNNITLGELIVEFNKKNSSNEIMPVYSVTNSEGFILSQEYFSKQVFSKNLKTYKIVDNGDFAYNPSRVNVGSIDFFRNTDEGLISPLYVTFRTKDNLNKQFLKYYLKSNIGLRQIKNNTSGSVRDTLSFKQLARIKIPLPTLDIQEEIVKEFDLISDIRQRRRYVIDLLEEYIKSLFLEMYGEPVANSKGWEEKLLKDFGDVITGNTPSRADASNYSENFIEWIKTDNIVKGKTYLTTASEYLSETGLRKARYVTPGAVLVACIAGSIESIGRVAMADRKVSFNQQINAIQPNKNVNPIFLYWLLKMSRKYVQSHATTGMKKILTKGNFEKIKTIMPPIEIQDRFAQIVLDTEELKQKMLTQKAQFENQFQSMMQKSFSSN